MRRQNETSSEQHSATSGVHMCALSRKYMVWAAIALKEKRVLGTSPSVSDERLQDGEDVRLPHLWADADCLGLLLLLLPYSP